MNLFGFRFFCSKVGWQHLDWQHFGLVKHWGYSCLFGLGVCTYLEPDHKISWKSEISGPFFAFQESNLSKHVFQYPLRPFHAASWVMPNQCLLLVVIHSITTYFYLRIFTDPICFFFQPNWRFSKSRPVTSRVLTVPISKVQEGQLKSKVTALEVPIAASDRCGEKIVRMTDHTATEEKWTDFFCLR